MYSTCSTWISSFLFICFQFNNHVQMKWLSRYISCVQHTLLPFFQPPVINCRHLAIPTTHSITHHKNSLYKIATISCCKRHLISVLGASFLLLVVLLDLVVGQSSFDGILSQHCKHKIQYTSSLLNECQRQFASRTHWSNAT